MVDMTSPPKTRPEIVIDESHRRVGNEGRCSVGLCDAGGGCELGPPFGRRRAFRSQRSSPFGLVVLVPRPRGYEPIVAKLPARIIDREGPIDGASGGLRGAS